MMEFVQDVSHCKPVAAENVQLRSASFKRQQLFDVHNMIFFLFGQFWPLPR
jgi:hypothetical protein